MNSDDGQAITPRWTSDPDASVTSAEERLVLHEVLGAIRRVRHGSVTLSIQDCRVVQIDTTEKRRL